MDPFELKDVKVEIATTKATIAKAEADGNRDLIVANVKRLTRLLEKKNALCQSERTGY